VKTKHIPKLKKLEPPQGLREDVGGVEVAWHMRNRYQLMIDMVPYPVVSSMHVLHSALMLWVFRDLDS